MQETYNKGLNKFIAMILILILTIIDFISIGANFVSIAIDANDSVKINAYFKDTEGKKITGQEINLNAEKIDMYIDISVIKEGYFNGKISLENSNLVIISTTKNEYISDTVGNVINLNKISNGKKITLELQLRPNTNSKMSADILNRETIVKLEGTYVHSKGQDEIKQTSIVNVKFVSPEDAKSIAGVETLSNKVYEIDGENKRILQLIVKSKIVNNVYPVQKSNIELILPENAESVDVIARDTSATNKDINFGENNYIYNKETSKLQIMLENLKDEKGNISFEQNAKDEFVVTCVYTEDKIFTKEAKIDLTQEILTYDNKLLKSDQQIAIAAEMDGIINYELIQQENEFYKGKIYTGEERDYKIIATSYINSTKVNENIKFTLGDTKYISEKNKKTSKIAYKEITIKEEEYKKILGEEGFILIKDENGVAIEKIVKETQVDQAGNIKIQMPASTYKIEIETSTPIQTGKINFDIIKTIKENDYNKDEIKTFLAIENSIISNEQTQTKQIALKETQTEAKLKLDKNTIEAGEYENIQMSVVLLSDDESKDLYKNPTVKIEFPKDVEEISAKYKILYLNGLEKDSAILKEENEKKVLELKLTGEQEKYPGEVIDGTEIIVSANIKMNKLMSNSIENIALTYTNEGATSSENVGSIVQEINVIQNEKFIVTNDIDELDVKTTGKEEDKNIYLEPSEEAKSATVKIGAINNEGEDLQDIKILGKFPTQNTMDINITSGIEVISETSDVKVYYSTKEDVTEDLTDTNNSWTEDITLSNKKSYLIIIPKLSNGESFNAKYGISIIQNVTENKIANEEFVVMYKKEGSLDTTKVQSTKVVFNIRYSLDSITATIEEPQGTVLLTSGSIYSYNLKIKNNTSNEIRDVQAKIKANELLKINQRYTNGISQDGILNIEKLDAGEEKNIEVFVNCLKKTKKEDKAIIYAEIYSDGESYETNKYICEIEDISAKISISSKASNNDENRKVKVGEQIDYEIKVENTCVDDLKSIQVRSTMTTFLKVERVTLDGRKVNYKENIEGTNGEYKIIDLETDINAGKTVKITISTKVEGEIIISSLIDITNYVEVLYNSRLLDTKTDEGYDIKNGESLNMEISEDNQEEETNSDSNAQDGEDNGNNSNIDSKESLKDNEISGFKEEKYKITGNVWLDENEKGDKSFSDKKISGIKVKLIGEDGNAVKDEQEKEISTQTNNNGDYVLENIKKGRYIVIFEYDSNKYKLTQYQKDGVEESNNSDAILKDILVDGTKFTVAATDILDLKKDIYNIDLGLVENKKFDLELAKTVKKITVTNNEVTKEYNVNDKTLAKVEIPSKQLNNSKVSIEYSIKVKNTGDVSGYVKNIVDYIPSGIEFNSNLNKDWNKNGEYLYNSSLNNVKIDPGEEKEISLILVKTITETNTGLVSNIAEIAGAQSSTGVSDIDSTPNNRKDEEDDLGQADVIIGVNTGAVLKYIILTICIFIILGVGIYLINGKVLKTEI